MGVLPYTTALATVQDALVDTISLGLAQRPVLADLTALAAEKTLGLGGTQGLFDKTLVYVTSVATCFRYSRYSTATPDGSTVIAPLDVGTAGRWLITSSTIEDSTGTALSALSSGYLRRVMLWAGERSDKVWKLRILNVRPAVVFQFLNETKTPRSNQRGALAEKTFHFSVWAVSQNLRPDLEAEKGSPITTEATFDPGVARMMGDLEYLLDGLRGVDVGVDGLDYMMFGAVTPQIEDYDGREFVWTAPLDVRVTVGKEDPGTRVALTTVTAQASDVQLHAASSFDPANYVISGLTITPGGGLTQAPADGSAMVGGALVSVSGASAQTFEAQAATWRDLNPDGSWTYTPTSSTDFVPPPSAGALRVAVTIASASDVIEDRCLAATATPIGPQDQIIP